MALWLYRTGRYGEHEQKFLKDNRIYLTWTGLQDEDLTKIRNYDEIKDLLRNAYSEASERRLGNHAGQVWAFLLAMKVGDWIVMPLKSKPAIAIAEITKQIVYDSWY